MSKEMLNKVVTMFDTIKNTSGSKAKEALIKEYGDNILFKEMLLFLYNPYIKTGIGFKKLIKFADFKSDDVQQFDSISDVLEYLKNNNTGKDENVKAVANFINSHGMDCNNGRTHDFLQEYFTEDVKIGATANTINKVFGKGTIPQFKVMLAESFAKKSSNIKGKFYVTKKIDGVRCVVVKNNGVITFFTRQGHIISEMTELEDEFKLLPDNTVYDGELVRVNDDNLPSDKLFRETQKIVRKEDLKTGLEFYMFDTLPVSEFYEGKSKLTYEKRREEIEYLKSIVHSSKLINILDILYKGEDVSKVTNLLNEAVKNNEEGVMVNQADGLYTGKRTDKLLKVKKFHSCDGIIKDIYEGEGKYKGMLGGVSITFNNIIVNIGSGFTEDERKRFWCNPDDIIGKIGEYSYFEESENQKGRKDLRFATWKGLRFDKKMEDVNYE